VRVTALFFWVLVPRELVGGYRRFAVYIFRAACVLKKLTKTDPREFMHDIKGVRWPVQLNGIMGLRKDSVQKRFYL
jgi:hypothetical protein